MFALLAILVGIVGFLLAKIRRDIDVLSVSNRPREGLPQHMEAAWEDIGAHGRWLTDLGGMSIKMREQMFEEFCKALNEPMLGISRAGSMRDVLTDMDEWLTQQKIEELEKQSVIDSIE
jgi:hypothetical protein